MKQRVPVHRKPRIEPKIELTPEQRELRSQIRRAWFRFQAINQGLRKSMRQIYTPEDGRAALDLLMNDWAPALEVVMATERNLEIMLDAKPAGVVFAKARRKKADDDAPAAN